MNRKFVRSFALIFAVVAAPVLRVLAAESSVPQPVQLQWLGQATPATPEGVSWGVPWPKGAVQKSDSLTLRAADGTAVPMQTWPLAFWPDGSIKWSGHAIAATPDLGGPLQVSVGAATVPANPIKATTTDDAIEIDTGAVRARFARQGSALLESLFVGDRKVAENARLVAVREDRSEEGKGVLRQEQFVSRIKSVTLEQSGPVRAVVKVEGVHQAVAGERAWLPFTLRFYFYAGSPEIRLVHTFIFDGDGQKDFIKGLGLVFTVPFREELHNRHVRFAGDGTGVWCQPVRLLPGYRPQAGRQITDNYADHLAGKRMPNLADYPPAARSAIESVAVYNDCKLTQSGPDGFSIDKRTQSRSSWLHVTNGRRALGLAMLGDVSGGIAVGVKDFWQKYPAALEISNAAQAAGELTVWLWSPDSPAMDLRTYDTGPHGLSVNYEDWKPGWGTANGIAHSADLTLWAFAAIPSDADLVTMAKAASAPAMLVCTPEYYHARQEFGRWSLPDRSTPTLAWVEDQVQGLVNFYEGQVDERAWYGFWDFGDIMHNYDFGRHDWRYDIGGWAWVNTELMPDMLLWYSFLRTGRADIFRMAEAMTRHTSEVDVYHIGPFAPLGSRHNVNHWGDGAKQPRIGHDGIKQFYYFLTTDERVGDLMREQLGAEATYKRLQQFNGSHYVPGPDGQPLLDTGGRGGPGGRAAPAGRGGRGEPNGAGAPLARGGRGERGVVPAPTPDQLAAVPAPEASPSRLGLEWMCYAMNWTMEYQRTGDTKWRDRVETDMKAMTAGLGPNDPLPGSYFDMIFGGAENLYAMEPMFDVPEFWRAWANTSEAVGRAVNGGQMTGPRMLAYAANAKKSPELGRMAWEKLIGATLPPPARPAKVNSAGVVKPVTDPAFLGEPVGWQLHGVASIQWALNALETLELAKPYLPDWEAARKTAPAATTK
jgi:YetA-like protein